MRRQIPLTCGVAERLPTGVLTISVNDGERCVYLGSFDLAGLLVEAVGPEGAQERIDYVTRKGHRFVSEEEVNAGAELPF